MIKNSLCTIDYTDLKNLVSLVKDMGAEISDDQESTLFFIFRSLPENEASLGTLIVKLENSDLQHMADHLKPFTEKGDYTEVLKNAIPFEALFGQGVPQHGDNFSIEKLRDNFARWKRSKFRIVKKEEE